ncbi:MAG: radical SAM protein [Candidatus Competibacteraceae bacterium]
MLTAIAELREEHNHSFGLLIQVDAPSYRSRDFVRLCAKAGVKFVFIGVESVNSDNLRQISKRQNRVERYQEMFQAWRKAGIHVQAGYILGFPGDTPDSIAHDVAYLLDEVGFDDVMFFYLTPLPGSADHRDRARRGEWLEPDLNRYNLHHPVTRHPLMSTAEWRQAYRDAWKALLDYRRIPNYLRAAQADGLDTRLVFSRLLGYRLAVFWYNIHPIEYGSGLRRFQDQRRPDRPLAAGFGLRQWWDTLMSKYYTRYYHWRIGRIYKRVINCAPPPLPMQAKRTL